MGATDQSTDRSAPSRIGGRVAFVAVGIALLALAAWSASRAATADDSPDLPGNARGGDAILNNTLLIAAGALATALLIYVAPILRQGRGPKRAAEDDVPNAPLWLRLVAGSAIILGVVAAVLLLTRNRENTAQPVEQAPPTTVEEVGEPTEGGAGATGWAALGLVTAGAAAAVIAVVWWKRRGGHDPASIDDFDIVASRSNEPLDLDALEPVDAIRAAYAGARGAISSLGVAARAPETPYEYLDRVRANAPSVQRPVATLTRLFEVARFSQHPITPAMKADAIAAYDAVMSEVARVRDAMVPA